MFAWFTADSGTFDCQVQFSVKTSLSEFSGFCHQESGDDISIDFRSLSTPLRECSHQDAHTPVVLFCCVCVFSFSCSPGRPRRVRQQWMSFS